MNGDDLTKEELLSRFLQLEQRVEELEQDNAQLREKLQEKDERIEELETRLRKYEFSMLSYSKKAEKIAVSDCYLSSSELGFRYRFRADLYALHLTDDPTEFDGQEFSFILSFER